MTDIPIARSDFYVYALMRPDGVTPFYIGKGIGRRMYIHERDARRFKTHKDRIIQRIHAAGQHVIHVKLVEGLTDAVAKMIEIDLIALLLRWPRGPLANITAGGDGAADLPPESLERKRQGSIAAWRDPEARARRLKNISAALSGRRLSDDHLRKLRERGAIRKALRPAKPPRQLKERGAGIRAYWANQVHRDAAADRMRKRYLNAPRQSVAERCRAASHLHTPAAVAYMVERGQTPEVRAKRVAAQRAAFSTPEAKAKRSQASKKMWAAKRAQKTAPSASASDSYPPIIAPPPP